MQKHFERMPLDDRLRMDKDVDPIIIIDSMDKLAEINYRALTETNSLSHQINQTLARGSPYPKSGEPDLPTHYGLLSDALNCMIDHVGGLTSWKYSPNHPDDHRKVLSSLEESIKPKIETIHILFKTGYHKPSPLPSSMTSSEINVLAMLDRFSGVFTEPVKSVSYLLAEGSKPNVKLGTVETVEEFVRVLQDVGVGRIRHLFHDIIHQEYYNHIKRVTINGGGFREPHIQGLGHSQVEKFQQSPMWPIAEAMIEYSKKDNETGNHFDSAFSRMYALMTPNHLAATMDLSYSLVGDSANASLHVTHDSPTDNYNISFHCGNKGYFNPKFMEAIHTSFNEKGYKCTSGDWGNKAFWVDRRSTGEQAKKDVRFILDNLTDKLRNAGGR
ncbi:MAG: hypothetical protein KKB31_01055 [Nanoarchaeota archaeon]|nr:hypothetical protein [Nanoarchaeota archaeon]